MEREIIVRVFKDYSFSLEIFEPYQCNYERIAIEMAQMKFNKEIESRVLNFNKECGFKVVKHIAPLDGVPFVLPNPKLDSKIQSAMEEHKKQWFDIIEKLRQEHSFANSGWTEEQAQKLLNILDENAKTAKRNIII